MTAADRLSEIAQGLRQGDYDRYILAMMARGRARQDLFILYGWNLEVARTRELVSEPGLGLIRLQWWRDRIEDIYGDAPLADPVPLVGLLADVIARHGLSQEVLFALLDSRTADVSGIVSPFEDVAALEAYADGTGGHIARLAAQTLGHRTPVAHDMAGEVGAAWALTGMIRALPFLGGHDWNPLPCNRQILHGLDPEAPARGGDGARDICRAIAGQAEKHLDRYEANKNVLGGKGAPLRLQAVLTRHYLHILDRAGYDPFTAFVQSARPPVGTLLLRKWLRRH